MEGIESMTEKHPIETKPVIFFLSAAALWASQLTMLSSAVAVPIVDMVLVPATPRQGAFYIDIFEATCREMQEAHVRNCDMTGNEDKPARMSFAEAQAYCAYFGKRLPSREEWLIAASNQGRNHRYSLLGDQIRSGDHTLANVNRVNSTGSANPRNTSIVGIDAIGTVGMTGNRPEWVFATVGANQAGNGSGQCGGGYENTDPSFAIFELSHLCDANLTGPNATARCILPVTNPSTRAQYSANVTANSPLMAAIQQSSGVSRPGQQPPASPPVTPVAMMPAPPPPPSENRDVDARLMRQNRYTRPGQRLFPNRLAPPPAESFQNEKKILVDQTREENGSGDWD